MAASMPRYESGDTRTFVVTYSFAPGSTPYFAVYVSSLQLVQSVTGTASSATNFFAYFTMPSTLTFYSFDWVASFTGGPTRRSGMFQVIRTRGD